MNHPGEAAAVRGWVLAGALLFVVLIVLFSIGVFTPPVLVAISLVGVASHLVLFPVVAALATPSWTRAAGYAWLTIDVVLNVAKLNGLSDGVVWSLRTGGHVLAATWIAAASGLLGGTGRLVGWLLALLLVIHAFAYQWVPAWAIYPPFLLVPIWLFSVWLWCGRSGAE